ncbi:hypothetical protein Btru_029548 [Bulinus truncatus]|nr:hypothetical protein Btru_029548 [Bulinus truncatus]
MANGTTVRARAVYSGRNISVVGGREGKGCVAALLTVELLQVTDPCRLKSLKNRLHAKMFTFDQFFQLYEIDKFALDFFKDSNVIANVQVSNDSGSTTSIGIKAGRVEVKYVPCSILSMTFFDKIMDGEIAREGGDVKKCFDDFMQDFTISDNLRQMLLNEDSDVYCQYNEKEREEFLFLLFSHLCLGGRLCQYEDNVQPYLDITKALYKDLISVQKNPDTKELSIISHVFKVHCYVETSGAFGNSGLPEKGGEEEEEKGGGGGWVRRVDARSAYGQWSKKAWNGVTGKRCQGLHLYLCRRTPWK